MPDTANPSLEPISNLIVMRHAKSDWGDASESDHERSLNDRGRRDAPRMAQWLAEVELVPDLILSSTSQRTRETAELMQSAWPIEIPIVFIDSLYLGTPVAMMRAVRSDGGDAKRLMVLAHNPGVSHLASHFANQTLSMPTAAIAALQLEHEAWRDFRDDTQASLAHYMRPKAL